MILFHSYPMGMSMASIFGVLGTTNMKILSTLQFVTYHCKKIVEKATVKSFIVITYPGSMFSLIEAKVLLTILLECKRVKHL